MKKVFYDRIRDIFGVDAPKEVAQYCRDYWPKDVSHVLRVAGEACRNQFLFDFRWDMERTWEPVCFEERIDWSLIPFGDREFLWQFNRHRFLLCLGQAYLMTGEEAYAEHFARLLRDWIENVREGENIDLGPWRTLETGLRAEVWLRSLCMVEGSRYVDQELIDLVEQAVLKHGNRLTEHFSEHKYLSNWGVLESSGLLLFSMATPDAEKKALWQETALTRLTHAARIQVLQDGTQWEQSPMYHNEVYQCFRSALYYGERAGLPMPAEVKEAVRKMAYVDGIWKKPDHTQFTQGDSDATDLRDQITAGAYVCKDGILKYLGYPRLDYESAWQFGAAGCRAYEEIEEREPDFLSAQLPFSGNYYFRSSWQEDGNLFHFHCGETGGGHGHADKLHVDLVLGGEDILVDAGRGTYVDGELRYELKEPEAHNVVLMDGKKFTECDTSWIYKNLCTCLKQQYFEGKNGAFAEGSHIAYLEDGVLANRRVIWIKPDIYVLVDYFYGKGKHRYETLFHFGRQGSATLWTPEGVQAQKEEIPGVHFAGEKARAWLQIVCGGGEYALRASRQSLHYNECGSNQVLTVSREAEGDFHSITVINGGKKDGASPVFVEKIPVWSVVHEKYHEDRDAEALRICREEKEYVLLLCHKELLTPTDILKAENCMGYGRAVLFDRTEEKEQAVSGETLAW